MSVLLIKSNVRLAPIQYTVPGWLASTTTPHSFSLPSQPTRRRQHCRLRAAQGGSSVPLLLCNFLTSLVTVVCDLVESDDRSLHYTVHVLHLLLVALYILNLCSLSLTSWSINMNGHRLHASIKTLKISRQTSHSPTSGRHFAYGRVA